MDEILYANIADLRTTEALSAEWLLLNADRNALPNHEALFYAGDAFAKGAKTFKVSHVGLMGYDELQPVGEGAAIANTPLTDGSSTVSVGRYGKAYEATDEAAGIEGGRIINPQLFAMDAVQSAAVTMTGLIADLADNFTAQVDDGGSDFTLSTFVAGQNTLRIAKVKGRYLAVIDIVQHSHLRDELLTATAGAVQWAEATQEQINLLGDGYQGGYMNSDLFITSRLPTVDGGANRAGMIFGRGAVLWADMSVRKPSDANTINIGGKLLFEIDRTVRSAETAWVTQAHTGVAKGIDARGCGLISNTAY